MAARDLEVAAEARARASLQAMLPRLADPPHALLGVAETATPEVLRQAFLRLTKQYHPTKFARFSPDVVRLANEVFLTIKRAYDQSQAAPRTTSAPVAAGTGTQQAVQPPRAVTPTPARATTAMGTPRPASGTGAPPLRASQPRIATPPFGTPVRPSQPRMPTPALGTPRTAIMPPVGMAPVAAAAPAAEPDPFEAALELGRRRLWNDARQAFQKLAVANPHEKKYRALMHWARGREAHEAGRIDEARAELQRALALVPDLTQARSALDSLPPEPGPGNVLSRLFKR